MKKIKKIKLIRSAVQLIMFFLIPGLYIMAFNELKDIIKMLIEHDFNLISILSSSIELMVVTLFTVLAGRFFCGWLCTFGAYNDLVYFISKKIFKTKFRINPKVDNYLKYIKYVILVVIILFSVILASKIFSSSSPWDAFAQITEFSYVIKELPVALILLALITVGAFFIERFFCRYLCPLGAFFSIISRIGFLKINKPTDKCGKCIACTRSCSMGIELNKKEQVRGGECINCFNCIEACPRKNTCVNVLGQDVNSTLAGTIAISAAVGIYGITGFGTEVISQASTKSQPITTVSAVKATTTVKSSTTASQKYKDGTYTGSGSGFMGGTTELNVTITNGKIAKIETISTQDTPQFYERVYDTEVNSIISLQSPDVDTVSGATYSSNGIIEAVSNALAKALNK